MNGLTIKPMITFLKSGDSRKESHAIAKTSGPSSLPAAVDSSSSSSSSVGDVWYTLGSTKGVKDALVLLPMPY